MHNFLSPINYRDSERNNTFALIRPKRHFLHDWVDTDFLYYRLLLQGHQFGLEILLSCSLQVLVVSVAFLPLSAFFVTQYYLILTAIPFIL